MFNLKSKIESKIKSAVVEKPAASPVRTHQDGNITVMEFEIIGASQPALESLGEYNKEFKKAKKSKERQRIYEYHNFINKPVTFDGYKILINNVIVGYAPPDAYPVLDSRKITSVYAKIYGGNYVITNETGVYPEYDYLHCSVRLRYK